MTKNEFEAWVDKTYHDFLRSDRHRYQIFERIVVVVDRKTGKTATAKCHNDDKFDANTGIAIAFARLKGWKVPEIDEIVIPRLKESDTYFAAGFNGHIYKRTVWKDDFCDLNAFTSECAARVTSTKIKVTVLLERIHEAVCPDYGLDWDKLRSELKVDNLTYKPSMLPCTIIRHNGKWKIIAATWYSPIETIFPSDIADKIVNYLNKNYACF